MGAKEHYDNHLGNFYSWMAGDLNTKTDEFLRLLSDHHFKAADGETAVDLGAGHGIQAIALAKCGYRVIAIDFNHQLLKELRENTRSYDVTVVNDDLRRVRDHADSAAVITCCGDTLTHLDRKSDIEQLVIDVFHALKPGGRAVFSFRDYSIALVGDGRFIPVKSDGNRILTCVLNYSPESVTVTDLLHERIGNTWKQS